jgi:hypothetical protein
VSLSKRVRFEVFKRDDFTCAYCGRTPPAVTLEADHIVPRVEGGGDEVENLTTSCMDCNRGKAGVPLENKTAVEDLRSRTELIAERERQILSYNEVREAQRIRIETDLARAWDYWFERYGEETMPRYYTPNESILRHYVKNLPLADVLDAIDIAVAKFPAPRAAAPKYFGGILRRKLEQHQGTE